LNYSALSIGQAEHFDNSPGVIIVPIMSVSKVRNWDSSGYEAIVVAGTAGIYSEIRVSGTMLQNNTLEECLATVEQCDEACQLLQQMILCVCNVACNHTQQFQEDLKMCVRFREWNEAVGRLLSDKMQR
jgi:hypothetical protein